MKCLTNVKYGSHFVLASLTRLCLFVCHQSVCKHNNLNKLPSRDVFKLNLTASWSKTDKNPSHNFETRILWCRDYCWHTESTRQIWPLTSSKSVIMVLCRAVVVVICTDSTQGITQTSLRPGGDPDPVIQLSEAPGMPRHLDLLLPGLRLLLLVSWWCIEYCITGDGHLDVTRVSGQYFISAIIFLQLNRKAQNHRKEVMQDLCLKRKCATSHDWVNTERIKTNPAAKHTCSFITLYN